MNGWSGNFFCAAIVTFLGRRVSGSRSSRRIGGIIGWSVISLSDGLWRGLIGKRWWCILCRRVLCRCCVRLWWWFGCGNEGGFLCCWSMRWDGACLSYLNRVDVFSFVDAGLWGRSWLSFRLHGNQRDSRHSDHHR